MFDHENHKAMTIDSTGFIIIIHQPESCGQKFWDDFPNSNEFQGSLVDVSFSPLPSLFQAFKLSSHRALGGWSLSIMAQVFWNRCGLWTVNMKSHIQLLPMLQLLQRDLFSAQMILFFVDNRYVVSRNNSIFSCRSLLVRKESMSEDLRWR